MGRPKWRRHAAVQVVGENVEMDVPSTRHADHEVAVGNPAVRGPKASSDVAYLNDLFRGRAEKAGIVYVDVWDGFVDEQNRFVSQGPDFEGQTRRLRSGDGVYFTKAGARKLAHYVEREIQRNISSRAAPVALPLEPSAPAPGARGPGGSSRPLAGPVIPLNARPSGGDELLGGARSARPNNPDPVATRVLTKGEAIPAPSGRADDFSWPRGSAPTVVSVDPASVPVAAPAAPPPAVAAPAATPPRPAPPVSASAQRTDPDAQNNAAQARPKRQRPVSQRDVPRPPAGIGQFFGR